MRKRDKIWIFTMIFILIYDVILHFTAYSSWNEFGIHINYVASVLMAFTVGVYVADTPRFKE